MAEVVMSENREVFPPTHRIINTYKNPRIWPFERLEPQDTSCIGDKLRKSSFGVSHDSWARRFYDLKRQPESVAEERVLRRIIACILVCNW